MPPATGAGARGHAGVAAPTRVTSVEGITEYRLHNGLRVLLFPDPTKSTVVVNITYFVGSRHEGYGESGMAHLLEHMVFKGTPTRPNVWGLLEEHGAAFNGTTWMDRTNYFEVLPASVEHLDFALALEADRMVNSKISGEDLQKEFSVVRNEFEMGESHPLHVLEERMYATAYLWHNYGKSTIGSRSDIERVPVENLRAFYQRHYQPDNAMLVVAGRFEEEDALTRIQKYFGTIPRPERVLKPTYTVEPVQDGERSVTLRRTGDVAAVGLMYHGLPGAHEDFVAEEAIVDALVSEPTGRLYRELVQTGMAARVFGAAHAWAEPGTLQCYAEVRGDGDLDGVRERMISAVEATASTLEEQDVERFRARMVKDFELSMADSQRTAIELSEWAAQGDWRLMFVHRDRVETLDLARVRRVAGEFLRPSNRTVGAFVPTKSPERAPLPESVDLAALVESYQGRDAMRSGDAFVASIPHIESAVQRRSLPVGLKVALLPKRTRGESVEGILTLHLGSEEGLRDRTIEAELIAPMLLRGTRRHSHEELRDRLDALKAEVSFGGRGPAQISVHFKTVRPSLGEVLALVAEALREPTFPEEQLEIVRKLVLSDLEQQAQDPSSQGMTTLARLISPWPAGDVRAMPSTRERIEGVKGARLEVVRELHRRFFGAANGELTIVGDMDPDEVGAALERHLGDFAAPEPRQRIRMPHLEVEPAERVIFTPDKEVAFVGMAQGFALRDDHPDHPALLAADYLLGASARSRLLERLRQKEGLSYGAFSHYQADDEDEVSILIAGAICAPQNAPRAVAAMEEEVARFVTEGPSEGELAEAKVSYQRGFETRIAQDGVVMSMINRQLEVGRTLAHVEEQNARIQSLDAAEIRDVLQRHVQPARMVRVRAGAFPEGTPA